MIGNERMELEVGGSLSGIGEDEAGLGQRRGAGDAGGLEKVSTLHGVVLGRCLTRCSQVSSPESGPLVNH